MSYSFDPTFSNYTENPTDKVYIDIIKNITSQINAIKDNSDDDLYKFLEETFLNNPQWFTEGNNGNKQSKLKKIVEKAKEILEKVLGSKWVELLKVGNSNDSFKLDKVFEISTDDIENIANDIQNMSPLTVLVVDFCFLMHLSFDLNDDGENPKLGFNNETINMLAKIRAIQFIAMANFYNLPLSVERYVPASDITVRKQLGGKRPKSSRRKYRRRSRRPRP